MFWLNVKKINLRISNLNDSIISSFSNVKKDTSNMMKWINYLHQKNFQLENKIKRLETELLYMPKNPNDIKNIIDYFYSYDAISDKLKELEHKILVLKEKPDSLELQKITKRLENIELRRKSNIKNQIVQRINRNSKEYIKSLIISYIQKYSQIGALQLKEMIVTEQGLCSKSSFYRILEELDFDMIDVLKKGREKIYFYKQVVYKTN